LKKTLIYFLIFFLLALSLGFGFYYFTVLKPPKNKKQEKTDVTIPQTDINDEADVVSTLLYFHAADYFVYRGVPIGFQYEMFRELEKGIGRKVNIQIETDAGKIKKELLGNNYDIIVMDFIHSGFLLPLFELSLPHSYSHPVLVSGRNTDTVNKETILVSSDFSAKLFFADDSPYSNYLIQREKNYSTEELFEKVDNGEIPYLICDYNHAITLMPFYSNVQILDKAGPQFERRWLLNKKNVQLNEDITHWLLDFKKTSKYRRLIQKYFSSESSFIYKSFARKQQGDISRYDDIIKKYAQKYGFDWRFVASIIYQETKFISGLTGKGGSYGLMQLMPATMEYYGISETDDDEANIRAGVQHLNSIRKSFDDIEDEEERLYFIAASYNAGRGHIFDAQRLCTKYEEDYKKWNDVSKYLKMKSQREIVADSLVRSGYFPGSHTVKYTQQVMERYAADKITYH
jgi:membrane-bound lytic murein transglycosylase F